MAHQDTLRHLMANAGKYSRMSSNIQIAKTCFNCGKEFTAKTLTTRYCGHAPEMVAEIYPHFTQDKLPDFGRENLWFL